MISVPVSAIVFECITLKDIISLFPQLCPILFQGRPDFCLVPLTLT